MDVIIRVGRRLLLSPFLWGGFATLGFNWALRALDSVTYPWLVQCLTGRWEAYVCVALFFVGATALVIRGAQLAWQAIALRRHTTATFVDTDDASGTPASGSSYLTRRLAAARQAVAHGLTGAALDTRLCELADSDTNQHEGHYDLVRFLTRSLPTVGCLATVLGIAAAISQSSAAEPEVLVKGVTTGLAQAFDTFALAIALSFGLTVQKFVVSQGEVWLLASVDRCVRDELQPTLSLAPTANNQAEILQQLAAAVTQATEQLSDQQALIVESLQSRPAAAGPAGAGFDQRRFESMVAQAVSSAIEQRGVAAPSGGGMDMAGWKPLQQVLQQVANYLARQQARQEDEGKVVQHLLHIIDDEVATNTPELHRPQPRRVA